MASLAACSLEHPIAGPQSVPETGIIDTGGDIVDAVGDLVDVVEDDRPDAVDVVDVVDAGDAVDVEDVVDVLDAGDVVDAAEPDAPDVADVPVMDAPDVVDVPVVDRPDVVDVPVDAGGPITQNIRPGESCADAPAMTATNGAWRYVFNNTGWGDDLRPTCWSGMDRSSDQAWRLTLPAPRRVSMVLRPTGMWRPVLSLYAGCGRRPEDPESAVQEREVGCVLPGGDGTVRLSTVLPAGSWFVVVDGSGGAYTLDVTIEDAPGDGGPDPSSSIQGACPAVPGNAARVALRDDEGSAPIALGFNFPLYGQQYTRLAISSNGFVQMLRDGDSPAGLDVFSNHVIPSDQAPNAILAPYWDDLDPAMNADRVRWWTTTGPRAIHVRWVDVPRWRRSDERVTVDLRVEETGWVEFRYCEIVPGTSGSPSLGTSATAGIESLDGRRGYLYSLYSPFALPRRQLRFTPR